MSPFIIFSTINIRLGLLISTIPLIITDLSLVHFKIVLIENQHHRTGCFFF